MSDLKKLKENLALILKEKEEQKKLDDTKRAEKNEADRSAIFESVGKDLGTVIGPYLDKLKEHSQLSAEELRRIISESVHVEAPQVDTAGLEEILAGAFANFKMPTPEVHVEAPVINVPPPVILPDVKIMNWPNVQRVLLDSIDRKNPLSVLVVDEFGKPFYGGMVGNGGGSGPKPTMDIQDFRGVSLVDSTTDPAKPVLRTSATVSFPTSSISAALVDSSGVQYSGSNPLSVQLTSGAGTLAANIVDSSGVAYSGSNPLPTTATLSTPQGPGDAATAMRVVIAGNSDSSVQVNSPINQGDSATALRIIQAGDSVSSVYANNPVGQGDSATALRVAMAGDIVSSVIVNNPQGPGDAATALRVLLAGNSDSSVAINSQTAFPIAQGDSATALRVVLAGNADSSVVVNSGTLTAVTSLTQFNGNAISTNQGDTSPGTLRVIIAGDSASSVVARGDIASGTADSGNPVKIGGVAKSGLITKVTDGSRVNSIYDLSGRQLTRMQAREIISTAYVTLSTGTEATLLAASAGNFLDLIYIMGANTSGAAVQVDIRAVTAGNIVATLYIPGNSTAGVSLPVPFPQDNQGNNWTVDMPDITNSNVLISALFSKEQ